jgi:hypothetical protein
VLTTYLSAITDPVTYKLPAIAAVPARAKVVPSKVKLDSTVASSASLYVRTPLAVLPSNDIASPVSIPDKLEPSPKKDEADIVDEADTLVGVSAPRVIVT